MDSVAAPVSPVPAGPPASAQSPVIGRGTCHVMFAYDVGFAIDLERAERMLAEGSSREVLVRNRPAPSYFAFDPPPVRITERGPSIKIAGYETETTVEIVLFDFGAVSVTYRIPIAGPVAGLLDLGQALYDNAELLKDSRGRVEAGVRALEGAIVKPGLSEFVEDYIVYEVQELEGTDAHGLLRDHARLVTGILRCESRALSAQEVRDALGCRVSYAKDDVAVVDWNATLVIDREPEDVRSVLEFANVELLEMRHLDDRLDDAMDEAYASMMGRIKWWKIFPRARTAELERIAGLQADSALLFESVNNALKLIGDQYLARVYRVAGKRLHMAEWDASILRKIGILESLYDKLADRRMHRRGETLEWIVIGLIVLEIVLSLMHI